MLFFYGWSVPARAPFKGMKGLWMAGYSEERQAFPRALADLFFFWAKSIKTILVYGLKSYLCSLKIEAFLACCNAIHK